jgi:hypothetical protein
LLVKPRAFDAQGDGVLKELESVRNALVATVDSLSAEIVSNALAGGDDSVREFLVSDDLWGGSGSIADQGGMSVSRDDSRRAVKASLVCLGEAQLLVGIVNVRTAMWVDAFQMWQRNGI